MAINEWNREDLCVFFQLCVNAVLLLALIIYICCKFSWTEDDKQQSFHKEGFDQNNTIDDAVRRTGGAFADEPKEEG